MRENRPYGSEGGARFYSSLLPLSNARARPEPVEGLVLAKLSRRRDWRLVFLARSANVTPAQSRTLRSLN